MDPIGQPTKSYQNFPPINNRFVSAGESPNPGQVKPAQAQPNPSTPTNQHSLLLQQQAFLNNQSPQINYAANIRNNRLCQKYLMSAAAAVQQTSAGYYESYVMNNGLTAASANPNPNMMMMNHQNHHHNHHHSPLLRNRLITKSSSNLSCQVITQGPLLNSSSSLNAVNGPLTHTNPSAISSDASQILANALVRIIPTVSHLGANN